MILRNRRWHAVLGLVALSLLGLTAVPRKQTNSPLPHSPVVPTSPSNALQSRVQDEPTGEVNPISREKKSDALAGEVTLVEGLPSGRIRLCQACQPVCQGVGCQSWNGCGEPHWADWGPIPFDSYFQGEYVGHARERHVAVYRLRVDDVLDFVYRLTREQIGKPYELNIGDTIRIEVLADTAIDRQLEVQPDGTISVPYLGQLRAARMTIPQLQQELQTQYNRLYPDTSITVTPIKVNTLLEDLRAAVDRRFGVGGQDRTARITPEGTIQLPAIGSIQAQGLTLDELKYEIDERYRQIVDGLDVTPVLVSRAPSYVFVAGEVRQPGRFTLERPTTAMGAVALAGGWSNGGNLREMVVFRRTEDWRLIATKLDLRGAFIGKRPSPADDVWLRDSDIVLVPKMPIKIWDDSIELIFTRGIYAAFPVNFNYSTFVGSR